MDRRIDHQITSEDFLFIAVELNQEILLCDKRIINKPNFDLGIKSTYGIFCRKLLGFITDKLITTPTDSGSLKQSREILAKISSTSLSLDQINPDSRIIFNGNLFRVEHKALYTHNGKNIYHDLKLFQQRDVDKENTLIEDKIEREEKKDEEKYPRNIWDLIK